MTGALFVERIDSVLREKNVKRQALADAIGINSSNFAHWKTKDYLPDVIIAYKIAQFLKVSVDWLLTGTSSVNWSLVDSCKLSPSDIFYRIEDRIRWLTNNHSNESQEIPDTLYKYLEDIVDRETLISWKNDRLSFDLVLLYRISEKLDIQFQWLLTGIDPRNPSVDPYVVALAEKYTSYLKFYDCLPDKDKEILNRLTEVLFQMTRPK